MSRTANDPPPAFAFTVAVVAGSAPQEADAIDGMFQEVSGLDPKVEIENVTEGGRDSFIHRLPRMTRPSNVVLKRGYVTQSSPLATWVAQTVESTLGTPIIRQVLIVSLVGPGSQPLVTWTFRNAWPVKWEVAGFDAQPGAVLTEVLEFAYGTVVKTRVQAAG